MADKELIYFTREDVLKRKNGWSKTLIEQLLGEPDSTRINPHYQTGPRVKLYLATRVLEAESTRAFIEAAERSRARREAAAKGVATKAAKRAEKEAVEAAARAAEDERKRAEGAVWLSTITIEVNDLPVTLEDAQQAAIRSWENWRTLTDDRGGVGPDWTQAEFLDRVTLNHLRHRHTNYDALIDMASSYGYETKTRVRELVSERLLESFPTLSVAAKARADWHAHGQLIEEWAQADVLMYREYQEYLREQRAAEVERRAREAMS